MAGYVRGGHVARNGGGYRHGAIYNGPIYDSCPGYSPGYGYGYGGCPGYGGVVGGLIGSEWLRSVLRATGALELRRPRSRLEGRAFVILINARLLIKQVYPHNEAKAVQNCSHGEACGLRRTAASAAGNKI
jgi:hypothetical protein